MKDVGEIVSGGTPSTKEPSYWDGDIAWISPADLSGYAEKYIVRGRKSISEAGLKNSSARLMKKGAVLFSSRAPIGYVAISANEVCTNQGFKSIVPNESVTSDYLYYYLKASKAKAEDAANGTTFKEISLKNFSALPIPLPPLAEQAQIVAKTEALFSELDAGKQEAEKALQQLKVYRQAVLKWAFEGRLTNENVDWKNVKLKDVSSKIVVGYVGPVTQHIVSKGGVKFLSTTHIGANEFLRHDIREVSKAFNEVNKKSQVIPGDIIIARHGDSGKACIIPEDIELAQVSNAVILRPNQEMTTSDFICYRLNYERQRMQLMKVGGVFQVVNTKSMEAFEISLPPLEEQHRIVQKIEERLSVCDEIESTIAASLQQAEALRQSILKKAFEGKLL